MTDKRSVLCVNFLYKQIPVNAEITTYNKTNSGKKNFHKVIHKKPITKLTNKNIKMV